jgi:hypothetical protein
MKIVIHHLTRMQFGYICLAGIDLATARHVRPVKRGGPLGTNLLARHGGPFDIGRCVDLGVTKYVGRPPEVEDFLFDPKKVAVLAAPTPAAFWELLVAQARPNLRAIFGPDLTRRSPGSCATDEGKGLVSLGCLLPTGRPQLFLLDRPAKPRQVRLAVSDGVLDLELGVTDIRLYGADHVTPDPEAVRSTGTRLAAGVPVVLSVGLSRPYTPSAGVPRGHWLQVNSIHLADDPMWTLG